MSESEFEGLTLKVLKCVQNGADLETGFGRSELEDDARQVFDNAIAMEWIEQVQWNFRLTKAGEFKLRQVLDRRGAWILRRLADGPTSIEALRDEILPGCCGLDQTGLAYMDDDDNRIQISAEGKRILARIDAGEDIVREVK